MYFVLWYNVSCAVVCVYVALILIHLATSIHVICTRTIILIYILLSHISILIYASIYSYTGQRWLYYLKSMTNSIVPLVHFDAARYCHDEARKVVLRSCNETYESPLHILARQSASIRGSSGGSREEEYIECLSCIHWLLYYGCDHTQLNIRNETAADVAEGEGLSILKEWIHSIVTYSSIVDESHLLSKRMQGLTGCVPLPGYSYMSLLLGKMGFGLGSANER